MAYLDPQRVKRAVDIVVLIGRDVELEEKGDGEYVGLCPEHGENSPSFSVSAGNQLFHCFGCGYSGSAIDYVMKSRHLKYGAALNWLWKRRHKLRGERVTHRIRKHRSEQSEVVHRVLTRITNLMPSEWGFSGRKHRDLTRNCHADGSDLPVGARLSVPGCSRSVDGVFVQSASPRQVVESEAQTWADSLVNRVIDGGDYEVYLREERELIRFMREHGLPVPRDFA